MGKVKAKDIVIDTLCRWLESKRRFDFARQYYSYLLEIYAKENPPCKGVIREIINQVTQTAEDIARIVRYGRTAMTLDHLDITDFPAIIEAAKKILNLEVTVEEWTLEKAFGIVAAVDLEEAAKIVLTHYDAYPREFIKFVILFLTKPGIHTAALLNKIMDDIGIDSEVYRTVIEGLARSDAFCDNVDCERIATAVAECLENDRECGRKYLLSYAINLVRQGKLQNYIQPETKARIAKAVNEFKRKYGSDDLGEALANYRDQTEEEDQKMILQKAQHGDKKAIEQLIEYIDAWGEEKWCTFFEFPDCNFRSVLNTVIEGISNLQDNLMEDHSKQIAKYVGDKEWHKLFDIIKNPEKFASGARLTALEILYEAQVPRDPELLRQLVNALIRLSLDDSEFLISSLAEGLVQKLRRLDDN